MRIADLRKGDAGARGHGETETLWISESRDFRLQIVDVGLKKGVRHKAQGTRRKAQGKSLKSFKSFKPLKSLNSFKSLKS